MLAAALVTVMEGRKTYDFARLNSMSAAMFGVSNLEEVVDGDDDKSTTILLEMSCAMFGTIIGLHALKHNCV